MDLITSDHLWKIQRFTAVVGLALNIITIIINLIVSENQNQKMINISVIAILIIFLLASLFINRDIMRYIQIAIFLIVGIFIILFDARNWYIGDALFITGVLLAYTYRLLSTYSYKTITIIIISIIMLRLISGLVISTGNAIEEIITASVSVTLILFLITLLKNELIWYIKESQKNDIYIRAGMNITGFAHSMDLGTAINISRTIRRKIEQKKTGSALHFTESLEKVLMQKNAIKDNILFAEAQNRSTTGKTVNIHKSIEAILAIISLDRQIFTKISLKKEFCSRQLVITAVPFEIYFILQNIIINAVEAMLRTDRKHILSIRTEKLKNRGRILISDTGPGFHTGSGNEEPNIRKIKSSKGDIGGFGLVYTLYLIKQNNILAEFNNRPGGGAEVNLTFTIKGEKDV